MPFVSSLKSSIGQKQLFISIQESNACLCLNKSGWSVVIDALIVSESFVRYRLWRWMILEESHFSLMKLVSLCIWFDIWLSQLANVCVPAQRNVTGDLWCNLSPRSGIPLCSTSVGQQETKDSWTIKCVSSKQGRTKSQHYFNFIPSILDEFDKHMQECNLVMDIASIHHFKKKERNCQ